MGWPKEGRKRLSYVLVAPILVPLWLTLPDTRTPRGKRFFVVTFLGSIAWIAAYSYLMVWWANVFGETADIPPEVSDAIAYNAIPNILQHTNAHIFSSVCSFSEFESIHHCLFVLVLISSFSKNFPFLAIFSFN